ncbi:MAG: hypothetical protein IJ775_06295 [Muribaculaceae bacterium]|nr:hypothetical protein [Muribaculaceae bacterium]
MKKNLLIAVAAILLTSCSNNLHKYTSSTLETRSQLITATTADLEVSPIRISYTMIPSTAIKNGGEKNVINAAVHEALLKYDNADVLLDLEYVLEYSNGKVEKVTVSGHPAKYHNYRSVN